MLRSIKGNHNLESLSFSYPFQYGNESEIPSTPSSMLPSGYYIWDTQEMIPQCLLHPFSMDVPTAADVDVEVTQVATAPNDNTFETT